MGLSKSSSKTEVYSDTGLPQETRKIQINNLTYHLKELEKEEQTKPKVSKRKEIVKIKEENDKIEPKNTIEKISKTKMWFFFLLSLIALGARLGCLFEMFPVS